MLRFEYINILFFLFHWLAMSNSCYNPFIYGIYSVSTVVYKKIHFIVVSLLR
jgi:hypothetical protein